MKTVEEIKEFINSSQIAILYLTTKTCNVCKVLKPKVIDIAEQYEIVKHIYIELDDFPELKGEYSVFAVPTIILFVEGKEALRYSRNIDLNDLDSKIDRFVQLLS